MIHKIKLTVLLVCIICLSTVFFVSSMLAQNDKKTAEQEYLNIQVLKGMPADDMLKVMDIMSASLGVKCNFCHATEQYEKDDKKEKETARKMIKMVFEINKNNFDGKLEVTCSSCHRGEEHPASFPKLGGNLLQNSGAAAENNTRPKNPTIDEVLDKYYLAIGGKAAIEKVTSRIMKVTRTDVEGIKTQEEIYQKAVGKMLILSSSTDNPYKIIFDGSKTFTATEDDLDIFNKDELELMKREAELFQPDKMKEVYTQLAVQGLDKINGKEVYIVRAATASGKRERLYFDKLTGLLVRRYVATQTILGLFPIQIDYLDYKLAGSVKIPFTVEWSTAGRVWTRKVLSVQNNIAIDDMKFAKKN